MYNTLEKNFHLFCLLSRANSFSDINSQILPKENFFSILLQHSYFIHIKRFENRQYLLLFTRLEIIRYFTFEYFFVVFLVFISKIDRTYYEIVFFFSFTSDSIDINHNEYNLKLPRHINRHYTSIKSNVSQHLKKNVTSNEEIPSNRRQIKQFRNEFIRKWTDDARNIYAQNHTIRSSKTHSDQMTNVDLEKKDRYRQKSTHRRRCRHSSSSSSSLLNNSKTSSTCLLNELHHNKTKVQSSNSTSLSSSIENQSNIKHQSNNSAIVDCISKKSNDNIECKIS